MKPLPARPAAEGVAHPLLVPRAALAPDPVNLTVFHLQSSPLFL